MLDAAGNVGPGVLEGSVHFLGMYEECIRVKATYENIIGPNNQHDYDANYCRIYWPLGPGLVITFE